MAIVLITFAVIIASIAIITDIITVVFLFIFSM